MSRVVNLSIRKIQITTFERVTSGKFATADTLILTQQIKRKKWPKPNAHNTQNTGTCSMLHASVVLITKIIEILFFAILNFCTCNNPTDKHLVVKLKIITSREIESLV